MTRWVRAFTRQQPMAAFISLLPIWQWKQRVQGMISSARPSASLFTYSGSTVRGRVIM
nr:hypothetical protein [Adlercreutzia caecimuris]